MEGEREHSMYSTMYRLIPRTLRIYLQPLPTSLTHFRKIIFPLSSHSCDKGSSGKSDACLVKAAHAEAEDKSPASSYSAVFWVTTPSGLGSRVSTSVHKPVAHVTMTGSL